MDNWENKNGEQNSYEYGQQNFIMVDATPVEETTENTTGTTSENMQADFENPKHKNKKKKEKKPKKPMAITRAGFIITLVICMMVTSVLSVGGMYFFNQYSVLGGSGNNDATNYTLTKSEETYSYESIISKNENAVVSIVTESMATDNWMQNYVTQGAGSGVIIDKSGYIITNNHVVEGASKITVTLKNNKEYSATIVGTDSENDIAVIKIKATNLTAATYGDSSTLKVGSAVVAIGNPLGKLGGTATTGIISALDRELTLENQTMTLLQTDASINPGNSGGGLFDASGNLVGIVVAKSSGSDVEGLGFAIPINTAAKVAKDIIENGNSSSNTKETASTKVGIGVTVRQLDAQAAQEYNLQNAGVYIFEITSGEALKAGFQTGDMIYYVGNTKISTNDDLSSALSKYKSGSTAVVTVIRDNQTVKLTTTLISLSE